MNDLSKKLQNVPKLQGQLKSSPEKYWNKRGKKAALKLFHQMAKRVPAYKKFLKENGVNPARIKTIKDFHLIPPVDKDNYLRKYERKELCWDGKFSEKQWVISTTSGSTGEPYYFPRNDLQTDYYAISAELYLRENFDIQNKSTLYIDAFAMGAWIGGVFTFEAVKKVASKGYSLSIITPGINKAEVINCVKNLGRDFDQVIIGCYPPILRDILDLGIENGVIWEDYNLGIIFSAEGFGEEFRDHITEKANLKNPLLGTLNHYGTVDMGTMSHETPLTNLIRKQGIKDRKLFHDLFGRLNKQPTLTQFIPEMFYFEEIDGGLLCTSNSGLPLVRYDLKDQGGILGIDDIKDAYTAHGLSIADEIKKAGIANKCWNLPFVYLYERKDFSVTFSGAQIYPEEIKRALLDSKVSSQLTGRFTMISGYDRKARNYLEVNIELTKNGKDTKALKELVTKLIVDHLLSDNSEYRVLYGEYKTKLHPRVKFWPLGHSTYFSGQGKQKWVKK